MAETVRPGLSDSGRDEMFSATTQWNMEHGMLIVEPLAPGGSFQYGRNCSSRPVRFRLGRNVVCHRPNGVWSKCVLVVDPLVPGAS